MKEEWKIIKVYEHYSNKKLGINRGDVCEVSTLGRCRINGEIVEPKIEVVNNNYKRLCFLSERLHRLVAKAFIPNPENKKEVDHIDRNPLNNRVDNLKWTTHKENMNNENTKKHMSGKGGPMSRTGRIWVKNEKTQQSKMILPEELQEYINNGYALGMLNTHSEKCSKSFKGRTPWNKGKNGYTINYPKTRKSRTNICAMTLNAYDN